MAATSCRDAIKRTWPKELQDLAILTMTKENGTEVPDRKGGINWDGSRDYGCMMLNNYAHPDFMSDWQDPVANTAHGYQIFKHRGNWSAWYAVCTPNKQPKYQGIWCK